MKSTLSEGPWCTRQEPEWKCFRAQPGSCFQSRLLNAFRRNLFKMHASNTTYWIGHKSARSQQVDLSEGGACHLAFSNSTQIFMPRHPSFEFLRHSMLSLSACRLYFSGHPSSILASSSLLLPYFCIDSPSQRGLPPQNLARLALKHVARCVWKALQSSCTD